MIAEWFLELKTALSGDGYRVIHHAPDDIIKGPLVIIRPSDTFVSLRAGQSVKLSATILVVSPVKQFNDSTVTSFLAFSEAVYAKGYGTSFTVSDMAFGLDEDAINLVATFSMSTDGIVPLS